MLPVASLVVRAALVALLLGVGGLAVVQAKHIGDDRLKPEAQATCWDCHLVTQNDCPPLQTFVGLLPGEGAGAEPGQGFDFTVQAQDAWCSDLYAVRVNLDLTNAPSLGFASGVPAVDELIPEAIQVDPQRANEAHRKPVPIDIPAGETHMEVRLRPVPAGPTGSDLTLLVYPPGYDVNGAPVLAPINAGGQGDEEVFIVEDRAQFAQYGYGTWTFVAEGRILPADGGGVVLPSPQGTVSFELDVDAVADSAEARVLSIVTADPGHPIKQAGGTPLTFSLVALAEPAPEETIALSADVWPHYTHKNSADLRQDDDENVTKLHPEAVPVIFVQGRTTIRGTLTPETTIAFPHNGATMATVSEAIGYATAFLLVSSIVTGGMFGKASRRGLNGVFGTAKRRVAFHNFLSYGILLAASMHTALFVIEAAFHWTLGLLWGGIAVCALLGLGVTGAIQVPLIRRWGYGGWRWTHYGLAVAAIVFTIVHALLDGVHFADIQNAVGWQDPLAPAPAPSA